MFSFEFQFVDFIHPIATVTMQLHKYDVVLKCIRVKPWLTADILKMKMPNVYILKLMNKCVCMAMCICHVCVFVCVSERERVYVCVCVCV